MSLTAPLTLEPRHELAGFDSGSPALDDWLRLRAHRNERGGALRTYVVCEGVRVAGYYTLATGAVARSAAPGALRRYMPEPIPVLLLGRLAVDRSWQGQGVGRGLLRDAVLRTLRAARIAGIRALLVQAIDGEAVAFYRRHGFEPSPTDAAVMLLSLTGLALARQAPVASLIGTSARAGPDTRRASWPGCDAQRDFSCAYRGCR